VGRTVQDHIPARLSPTRRSTADLLAGLSPEAARHATRNFRFGVLNGVMFSLVDALLAPGLVLAWFVSRLGGDNVLVGLLPAILTGGWFLPQMLVASRVQGQPLVMRWYRSVGILRCICMGGLGFATVLLAATPGLLLGVFFLLFVIYSLAAGVSGLPWLDMVNKMIAPRRRGSFFGQRNFYGGVLALAASAPIGVVLSEQLGGLVFPYNFALLFGVTALVVALGITFWSSTREPAARATAPPVSVRSLWRRGMQAFREDRDYRALMLARILLAVATVADPFYVVYAKNSLQAPPATVGLYLAALSVSSLLSNFIWSPLSDRASNRTLMVLTVCSVAAVPLTALLLASASIAVDHALLYPAFALVFILSGNALGSSRILNNNMLLTVAPAAELPTYVGFLNTVLGVVVFVPVLGGALIDLVGYEVLFGVAAIAALSGFLVAGKMSAKRPF
jgi:predicted MFS family arabinose efflux permease